MRHTASILGTLILGWALLSAPAAFAFSSGDAQTLGKTTAEDLAKRYASTQRDCGSSSRPAFLCSGVILRGTQDSSAFDAWNPSPRSVKSGGVSFSFLRQDAKFGLVASNYTSGFVLYPIFGAPKDKMDIEVLCSFPVNGGSAYRGNRGCGASAIAGSAPCQGQAIMTGEQWARHYNAFPGDKALHQCAFDVSDNSRHKTAEGFYQSLVGRQQLQSVLFAKNNELVLATWPQNIPAKLPIQAFFYVGAGVAGAKNYQKKFYDKTQIFVPVIRLTLPKTPADEAVFEFRPEDQSVTFN